MEGVWKNGVELCGRWKVCGKCGNVWKIEGGSRVESVWKSRSVEVVWNGVECSVEMCGRFEGGGWRRQFSTLLPHINSTLFHTYFF